MGTSNQPGKESDGGYTCVCVCVYLDACGVLTQACIFVCESARVGVQGCMYACEHAYARRGT